VTGGRIPGRNLAQAAGAYLVLLTLAFWPAIFSGWPIATANALRDTDSVYPAGSDDGLSGWAGAAARVVRNPHVWVGVYDPAFYWIDLPNDSLNREMFLSGEWPLWNPYVGLGTPLLGTGQAAPFSPLKLLVYLAPSGGSAAPDEAAVSLYLVLRLYLAALATYGLARTLGLGHGGALLAGAGYGLSATLVMHVHNIDATPPALLPGVLWAVERLIHRPDSRSIAVAGLTVGLLGNSGHPEAALLSGSAAVVFAVSRLWERGLAAGVGEWRAVVARATGGLGAAALVAAALSSLTLLPLLEYAGRSGSALLHVVPPMDPVGVLGRVYVPLGLHLLTPLASPQTQWNVYVGPLALLLGWTALAQRPLRPAARSVAITVGVSLLAMLALRDVDAVALLPVGLRAIYAIAPITLGAALLSGIGLERLTLVVRTRGTRSALRHLTWPASVFLALGCGLWDLSHDAVREPGPIALLPLLWVVLAGAYAGRSWWWRKHASPSPDAPALAGWVERMCATVGLVTLLAAGGMEVLVAGYEQVVGQAVIGMSTSAAGVVRPWFGQGRLSTGQWTIGRAPDAGALRLPPLRDPLLEWSGAGRAISLEDAAVSPGTGVVAFTAAGERFEGRIRGAFHRVLSPPEATSVMLELGSIYAALLFAILVRRGRWLVPAALVITSISLVALTAARVPPMPPFGFFKPPSVAWLQQRLEPGERVAPVTAQVLTPNTNVIYRIPSVGLQDPVQSCRYQKLLDALARSGSEPVCDGRHASVLMRASPAALTLIGARFALFGTAQMAGAPSPPTEREVDASLPLAYSDGRTYIFEHPTPPRRAALFTSWTEVPENDRSLPATLIRPEFDAAREVVLERPAGAESCTPGSASGAAVSGALAVTGGTARLLSDRPGDVRVSVSVTTPAVLLLSESNYPGWEAYVDGSRATLCTAYYLFQAVPLQPGEHEVHFVFRSRSFGLALVLAVTALGVFAVLRLRRPRGESHPAEVAAGWVLLLSQAMMLAGFGGLLAFLQ